MLSLVQSWVFMEATLRNLARLSGTCLLAALLGVIAGGWLALDYWKRFDGVQSLDAECHAFIALLVSQQGSDELFAPDSPIQPRLGFCYFTLLDRDRGLARVDQASSTGRLLAQLRTLAATEPGLQWLLLAPPLSATGAGT